MASLGNRETKHTRVFHSVVLVLSMWGAVTAGCGSAKAPATYCNLPDGRRIEAGAAFGKQCNCCVCTSAGKYTCQAAPCRVDGGAGAVACQTDSDCVAQGSSLCVFDPGCDSPRGTCIDTLGACPLFLVSELSPFEYCGCDGVTYSILGGPETREYPHQPYRHFGACP